MEEGTHADLVLEGGVYASLVARQSGSGRGDKLQGKSDDSVALVHQEQQRRLRGSEEVCPCLYCSVCPW